MLFILAIIALFITVILVPVLIPTLKRMKFGQSIREEAATKSYEKNRYTYNGWAYIPH